MKNFDVCGVEKGTAHAYSVFATVDASKLDPSHEKERGEIP